MGCCFLSNLEGNQAPNAFLSLLLYIIMVWAFWGHWNPLTLLNCVIKGLLRVPWTARRSNQSILKEISPGISLEGVMLTLNLQYFVHLMRRVDSLEKTLILGGIGGRRRRGRQRMRWLDGITDSMDVSLGELRWWTGRPGVLRFMGSQRVGHDWATELNLIVLLVVFHNYSSNGNILNWMVWLGAWVCTVTVDVNELLSSAKNGLFYHFNFYMFIPLYSIKFVPGAPQNFL